MSDVPDGSVVTITQEGERLIAVRSAHEPDARARLRHEAAVLSQLDHPGVVRLVDHREGPPARIRTSFVGPDSWLADPPRGAAVSGALAVIGATLADLHEAGLTHGDLRAEHVVDDEAGRPVLCGLAHAGPATTESIEADVRAFVDLGRTLASDAGEARATIESLLNALETGHDDLRETIRGLDRRRLPAASPTSRTNRRTLAAAAAVVVGTVLAILVVQATRNQPGATPPVAEPASLPEAAIGPAQATVSTPRAEAPAAPIGAAELVHQGRLYAIGQAGDIVVTGDWDCDGTPTPALLRPTTGEVAVFAEWPAARASIAPASTTVVDGATDLTISDDPCPTLRATTHTGSRLIAQSESS